MSAAYFLGRAGVPVTIFERADVLGGVVRQVIPSFRISDDAIDKMFRQISDSWTQRVIATAVDNLIHVDNHIFYSTGKVRYDGKDHTVSVGAFGHVFTVDKEDIKAAAEQYYTKAEREAKEDIRKKAEKIINDNVIDPAAQAIKEMVNGAMNDIIQDIGITGGSSDQQDEDEPADSTNI